MRLFYNTNGFAHHRLEDVVDLLADLGYEGIALTPDVGHLDPFRTSKSDVDVFRQRVEARGLGITIEAGSRYLLDPRRKHLPNLLSFNGFERRQEFYRRLIDLAADLGSPLVSIWSGRAGLKMDPGVNEELLDLLAERLKPVLDHAALRGILLCFEPEPGMLVETLAEYDQIVSRLGSQELWLTIDTGHLAVSEEAPFEAHLATYAGRLQNMHLDDCSIGAHEHKFFGDGDLDFAAISHTLRAIDYKGPVAVELSRHSHVAPDVAKRAYQQLRRRGF